MKLDNMLTKIGALLCTSLLGTELAIVPAFAQSSSNAFVVFVNGSGDCCAGAMWDVKHRLERQGATIWTTSYASFRDGSTTNKAPVVNLSIDMDNAFILEAAQVLNSVPKNRPIILVGHSYGGDSILKVLPSINRRVQLVVTIDPVGTGGFRQIATSRRVPSNVDYFMNRWEENGLEGRNIVPFDSRTNGSIPCSAGVCDQDSQNLARNADGSEIRVSCGAEEVTCEGWRLPGCNLGGCWKGSNGTKARRMFHNDMPIDDSIQRTVSDKIQEQLAAFRPPLIPLWLYWNGQREDNSTVANPTSINEQQQSGYVRVSIQGCIFAEQQPSTIPLRLFWNNGRSDNSTVANPTSIDEQQQSDYVEAAIQGYVYPDQQPGTIPLRLFWNNGRSDNSTVANPTSINEQQQSGYVGAAIQGYVYPENMCK